MFGWNDILSYYDYWFFEIRGSLISQAESWSTLDVDASSNLVNIKIENVYVDIEDFELNVDDVDTAEMTINNVTLGTTWWGSRVLKTSNILYANITLINIDIPYFKLDIDATELHLNINGFSGSSIKFKYADPKSEIVINNAELDDTLVAYVRPEIEVTISGLKNSITSVNYDVVSLSNITMDERPCLVIDGSNVTLEDSRLCGVILNEAGKVVFKSTVSYNSLCLKEVYGKLAFEIPSSTTGNYTIEDITVEHVDFTGSPRPHMILLEMQNNLTVTDANPSTSKKFYVCFSAIVTGLNNVIVNNVNVYELYFNGSPTEKITSNITDSTLYGLRVSYADVTFKTGELNEAYVTSGTLIIKDSAIPAPAEIYASYGGEIYAFRTVLITADKPLSHTYLKSYGEAVNKNEVLVGHAVNYEELKLKDTIFVGLITTDGLISEETLTIDNSVLKAPISYSKTIGPPALSALQAPFMLPTWAEKILGITYNATYVIAESLDRPSEGVGAAHTIDVAASNYIASVFSRENALNSIISDLDTLLKNIHGVHTHLISFGGPGVNIYTKKYNDLAPSHEDKIPVYFVYENDSWYIYSSVSGKYYNMTNDYWQGKPVTDYAMIELIYDDFSGTYKGVVLIIAGLSGYSTFHAAKWLSENLDIIRDTYKGSVALILKMYDPEGDGTPATIEVIEAISP